MTEFNFKYPQIDYLMSHFHQDADLEYENIDEFLESFCFNSETFTELEETLKEIQIYLSHNYSLKETDIDLREMGNDQPYPKGLNPRKFLEYITNYIQNYLEAHSR